MTAPLSHIRVLDLSRVLAGPWASQTLADLGADVIKVERPGQGDDTRHWGPPFLTSETGEEGDAAYFLAANRNKRSITVDFQKPEGQDILHQLAQTCDVVLENFKPGGLAHYGLDYETLKGINPRLVYCSITGFGQTGPCKDLPGYDFMIQGEAGYMSVTGFPDEDGGQPLKTGVAVADLITGLYAATAIGAALTARERDGRGRYLDLALFDCLTAALANQATNYLVSGDAPQRLGNRHPNIAPYEAFPASDAFFIIAVGNDGQFGRLLKVLELDDLARDSRFSTNESRVRHHAVLSSVISEKTKTKRVEDWISLLKQADVPCGRIRSVEDVFDHPQAKARKACVEAQHALGGAGLFPESPLLYAGALSLRQAPPVLGQHTEDILQKEIGLDAEKIKELRSKSVL